VEDRKFRLTLGILYVTKHMIVEALGFNIQNMYEAVCAAAYPELRIMAEFVASSDPEFKIDDEMNALMNTIADIVCPETERLTSNILMKMLLNDPMLHAYKYLLKMKN
jgi:hypothetical protein